MNKTALIIGDSPLIKKVEYELPYILNKYFSLGINRIIQMYPTSKHIFLDVGMINITNKYQNIPVITVPQYDPLIITKERELINTFCNPVDLIYDCLQDIKIINQYGELAWCGFTHDYAISYLIHQGYKNIVLIGTADFTLGTHYINKNVVFHRSDRLQKHSIQFINYLHQAHYATFYTINENSPLNINYITVEDLMNQTLDKADN